MRDRIGSRPRRRRKPPAGSPVLVWVLGGVAILIVVGAAVGGVLLVLGKGKLPGGGGNGGAGAGGSATAMRVTLEAFRTIPDGATESQISVILGGVPRPATSADIEALLPPLYYTAKDREPAPPGSLQSFRKAQADMEWRNHTTSVANYEKFIREGSLRVWSDGGRRVVVNFFAVGNPRTMAECHFVDVDGSKYFRHELAPRFNSKQRPAPTEWVPTTWEEVVGAWEDEADPRTKVRFSADKKTLTATRLGPAGAVEETVYQVEEIRTTDGWLAPQVNTARPGEPKSLSPAGGTFHLEGDKLLRRPGSNLHMQRLRRVN